MGGLLSSLGSVAKPLLDKLGSSVADAAEPALNYAIKAGSTAVSESGPFGEYLVNLTQKQKTLEANLSGDFASQTKKIWDAVPEAEQSSIHTSAPSPAASQALTQNRAIANQATNAMMMRGAKNIVGGVVGPLQQAPDFFPKIIASDVFKSGPRQDALTDFLTQSGQLPTKADAEQFIGTMKGMTYGRKGAIIMHDMMGLQVPDEFLEKDPKVAFSMYGDAAARYITKADNYGTDNRKLDFIVNAIGTSDGWNAKVLASDYLSDNEYGYYRGVRKFYEGRSPVENTIKDMEGLMHLGSIGIPHSVQSLNTLLATDMGTMAKSLAEVTGDYKTATDFSLESGATITEALRNFKNSANGRGQDGLLGGALSTMFHYTGFDAVRGFNLTLAAVAGKNYALKLGDQLLKDSTDKEANAGLKILGLEPSAILRQGGLSQQDIMFAARRNAEQTQFLKTPGDYPLYWNKNPAMRTLMLYKNYIFNEGKFIKDFGFKQAYAAGKLPQNVTYMSLLFPVVGELIGDTEMLAKGENPNDRVQQDPVYQIGKATGHTPNELVTRYIDNLSRLGSIGVFMSMLGSFNHSSISSWIGGPVAGDIDDANRVGRQLLTGKGPHGKDSAKKLLLNKVPVVGNILGNTLYGKNK